MRESLNVQKVHTEKKGKKKKGCCICNRKVAVTRNGLKYCQIHDPERG